MGYLKIEGRSELLRDEKTNAILNKDMNGYESYLKNKKIKEDNASRMKSLENEVSNIKEDLSEIKNLLISLVSDSK